jgi:hypothetical protein
MRPPARLDQLEIVVPRFGAQPEAVFDLAAAQVSAVGEALVYYRRVRFAGQALDAAAVLKMRALDGLAEQAHTPGEGAGQIVFRINAADARVLAETCALYVADRDVESYQSPEERDRIALLSALSEPLRQVSVDLRAAEAQLARQACAAAGPQ